MPRVTAGSAVLPPPVLPPIKRRVRTSRKAAEVLRLEIERLARQLGIPVATVWVRRAPDAGTGRGAGPRPGPRRRR